MAYNYLESEIDKINNRADLIRVTGFLTGACGAVRVCWRVGVRPHAGMTSRFMCRRPYAAAAGCRSPGYGAEEPAMSTCPGARVPTPRSVRVTRDVAVYGGGGRARG